MKRISLKLDREKLELARKLLGERTYSGAVNTAINKVIRRSKVKSISKFFGSGLWEGSLGEMREDKI
jgi:hypothetical protein